MERKGAFFLALAYLIVILGSGLIFFVKPSLLSFLPNSFGPVPVGVPWFGALGAVLISLTGVFEHEHDWDVSYWPWHVARPLVGVALGVVSVLILQAGVLSVGFTPTQPGPTPTPTPAATPAPTPTPQPKSTQPVPTQTPTPTSTQPVSTPQAPPTLSSKNLLYYLVAFLVGYREETFRELIKRLVDIVLAPGNVKATAPTIHDVNPAQAPHGTPTPVTITGSGFSDTQSVKFGNSTAKFTINGDGKLTATTPTLQAGGPVALTVTTKGGSASTDFTFS